MRYHAQNKSDIDKIAQSLAKLAAEDATLKVVNDAENHQSLIYGMGDMHLEIAVHRPGQTAVLPSPARLPAPRPSRIRP